MLLEKVPPQNTELEKAILGAIMLEKRAYEQAAEIIQPEFFYNDQHAEIFEVMSEMHQKGIAIDLLTVVQYLNSKGRINESLTPFYVTSLTNHVASSAHLQTHCKMIAELHFKRTLIRLGNEFIQAGFDETSDTFDTIQDAEKKIYEITNRFTKSEVIHIDSATIEVVQRIEALRDREDWLTGVPSGYVTLDRITNGWQEPDLIILAARPACGKTACSLNFLTNAAQGGTPVGIFNLEMSGRQVTERILANISNTPLSVIKNARFDENGMQRFYRDGVQKIADLPIYLDDTAGLTVYEFKAKARRMVQKYGVKLIVLDYLQLMKSAGKKQSREQEIADISRELKLAAKELNVPIIALSQLSRDVERRGGTPMLSDLRESGAIEQDADIVCFLYGHSEAEILHNPDLKNEIMLKIAKHRNGDLQTVYFTFEKAYQRFVGKEDSAANSLSYDAPF